MCARCRTTINLHVTGHSNKRQSVILSYSLTINTSIYLDSRITPIFSTKFGVHGQNSIVLLLFLALIPFVVHI
jgi:hypothetical protein